MKRRGFLEMLACLPLIRTMPLDKRCHTNKPLTVEEAERVLNTPFTDSVWNNVFIDCSGTIESWDHVVVSSSGTMPCYPNAKWLINKDSN